MLVFNFLKKLRISNSGPGIVLRKMMLWCMYLFVAFTILFKFAEGTSWNESVWQAWQTFTTVGYGNQPAVTLAGRIVTMLLSTLGIAFVGALFGAAFDYKQFMKDQKRLGNMENPHKNGYVVLNYPGDNFMRQFIRELRLVEPKATICIVDEKLEHLPEELMVDTLITYVRGSLMDKETYTRANVTHSKVVIVNPSDPFISQSDGASKTIVGILEGMTSPSTRIIHLMVDQKNEWMFENSRSTTINVDMEVLALVQECQDEHSSTVIENLLHNSKGANPQTIIPQLIQGMSWGELVEKSNKAQKELNTRVNLLAVIKGDQVDSCPTYETIIEKGDKLSLIAFESFNWIEFEKVMKELD